MLRLKNYFILTSMLICSVAYAGNLLHCPQELECNNVNCVPFNNGSPDGGSSAYWPNQSGGARLGIYPFSGAISDAASSDSKCIYSPPASSGFASIILEGNYLSPYVTDTNGWDVVGKVATCKTGSDDCPFTRPQ